LAYSYISADFFSAGCKSEEIDYECYSTLLPNPARNKLIHATPGLKLSLPEDRSYKQDDVILIRVENSTGERIWLAKDYSIRPYEILETNHYKTIDDVFIHDLEENRILEPNGEIGSVTAFFVQPDILIEGESKEVYIFIWGNAVRDGEFCTDKYGGGIITTTYP